MNKILLVVGLVVAVVLVARLNTVVYDIQNKEINIVETINSGGYFDNVSLTHESTVGTGDTRSLEFTLDGEYLAVGIDSATKLKVYEWNPTTTDYDVISVVIAGLGSVYSVDFNDDDSILAVGHTTSPFIKLYDASNNFNSIANDPDLTVDGIVYDLKYYEDEYLVVGGDMTNNIQVFKYNATGDYVALSNNIDTLPTGRVTDIDYNNGYLHISTVNTPYIITYKVVGDNLVKLNDPTTLPTGIGNVIETSDNGMYLLIGHNTTPFITAYKFENETYTDVVLDNIGTQSIKTNAIHFIDNSYFYAGGDSAVYKYKLVNGEFIQQLNDATTFNLPVNVIDCNTTLGRLVVGDITDFDLYLGTSTIIFENITLQYEPDTVNSVIQVGVEKDYILIDNIMSITDEIYNRDITIDYDYIIVNDDKLIDIIPIFGLIGLIVAVIGLITVKRKR